jgi:hypothetical protein
MILALKVGGLQLAAKGRKAQPRQVAEVRDYQKTSEWQVRC